jgi:broad specificity phosphatase PhoE
MPIKARNLGLVAAGIAVVVVANVIILRLYCVFSDPKTTVLLVRHAERNDAPNDGFVHDDGSRGPDLTDDGTEADGESRARVLAHVAGETGIAGEAGVAAIYHTEFRRTRQTIQPLDDLLPNNATHLVRHVLDNYRGRTVVIASHSDKVPEIISGFDGPTIPNLEGTDFDNLYVITVTCRDPPKVVRLKYGRPTPP